MLCYSWLLLLALGHLKNDLKYTDKSDSVQENTDVFCVSKVCASKIL